MAFERAPEGLAVTPAADSVSVAIHPFLPESGRNDLRMLRAGRYLLTAAGLFGLVVGDLLARVLALGLLVGGVAWMVAAAVRSARRQRSELVVAVSPNDVRVTVETDRTVDRDERVFLREVGRVDVVEAGYQRWHVVANVVGREPLVIEMERHTAEAAQWMARELAASGKAARDRDGEGIHEVPGALRRLTQPIGS